MASFKGTNQEFKRYIGPRLRNLVQLLTRQHKASVAACEHCGSGGELEAAHVHGRDRTDIVEGLLGTADPAAAVEVDLDAFEASFKAEHDPLERAFLILCTDCHRKYDAQEASRGVSGRCLPSSQERAGVLPITLDPASADVFKAALLLEKAARLTVYYGDGRVEHRPWDAGRFTATSNVFGNLRSRPEFRQGEWQSAGIVKVHVRVGADA